MVVFMEQNHQDYVAEAYPETLLGKKRVCLSVQDLYYYDEPELKTVLESKMKPYLKS